MKIIENIIFDDAWRNTMNQIDEFSSDPISESSFECYHGYRHALAVGKYAVSILNQLGADEHEVLLGKVSGLVHDIALIGGKENHAERGAEKSREFLKRVSSTIDDISDDDIDKIAHAIANHSNGEEIINNLDLALLVADKMDVTKNRLAKTDGELSKELNKVHDVSIEITDKDLVLKYQTDPDFNKKAIKHWSKMVTIPQKAAEHLKLKFVFKINNKPVDLEFIDE